MCSTWYEPLEAELRRPLTRQFATLICVFTLDRIGRRWTLYWGSTAQGIAMFLAGGFSRLAIDARHAGNTSRADSFGAAAASMVFVFTSVFGATWLTGRIQTQTRYNH